MEIIGQKIRTVMEVVHNFPATAP